MKQVSISGERLLNRLRILGQIGRDTDGKLTRLAASDADKLGRDQFVTWIEEAGLRLEIDKIGNIFGLWEPDPRSSEKPLMIGSHIDTVIHAGIYDGCYGVLAGLEIIETLKEADCIPSCPLVVAAFTNEEGVRYAPDMMGSLVYAGGLDVNEALKTTGTDGSVLGAELEKIGYSGHNEPGFIQPSAYLELHIEQGPILEREGITIGAVENLQGISWQRVVIDGDANHAGTTPITMRRDAGYAAARIITFLRDRALASNTPTVATVGCIGFEPNAINVIPSRAFFTVDLRDPNEEKLKSEEQALSAFIEKIGAEENVEISVERLARFQPVKFDRNLVAQIEHAAKGRTLTHKKMTSGAGHDAQMIARIAPTAMIFVPSKNGISHNPKEFTADNDLIAGANVLLDVVCSITKPD